MSKWYALALIVIGLMLYLPSKPPGEFGLPLYALLGAILFIIGVAFMGVLIFIRI